MSRRTIFGMSLILVAVFAFAFGLAYVTPVQAGGNPCCTIEATPYCTEGVGTFINSLAICVYAPDPDDSTVCQYQIPPQCF
ncbi:MAG: hypothetical protein AB1744_13080 [Candidatus Zixiibacteriota bacterium]